MAYSDGNDVEKTTAANHHEEPHSSRSWASLLHINGISGQLAFLSGLYYVNRILVFELRHLWVFFSVYVEELDEDGAGGAVMVSAVVRAPPSDVARHLIRKRRKEGLAIFAGAKTLKVIDDNTHIIGQTWKGSGLIGRYAQPACFAAEDELTLYRVIEG